MSAIGTACFNARFSASHSAPRMPATVREAPIDTSDELRSAKHQRRPDTGLSGSSNIAASLSGPSHFRCEQVPTGPRMTEIKCRAEWRLWQWRMRIVSVRTVAERLKPFSCKTVLYMILSWTRYCSPSCEMFDGHVSNRRHRLPRRSTLSHR